MTNANNTTIQTGNTYPIAQGDYATVVKIANGLVYHVAYEGSEEVLATEVWVFISLVANACKSIIKAYTANLQNAFYQTIPQMIETMSNEIAECNAILATL